VKSTFSYPSNPNLDVAVFLDACRILKLIRNTLAEKSVQSVLIDADGNYIKWDYLKNCKNSNAPRASWHLSGIYSGTGKK